MVGFIGKRCDVCGDSHAVEHTGSGNSTPLVELPHKKHTAVQPPGATSLEQRVIDDISKIYDEMTDKLDASEITITFSDTFMNHFNDMDEIISLIRRYFASLPLSGIREILLVPEYGATLRLHFHGVIRGTKKDCASLLRWLRKRFGRTTISMIRNTEEYKRYILKEKPEEYVYNDYAW